MSQTAALPNAQQLAGAWNKIRGQLREKWGQLTEDELEQYKGNVDQLVGHIQERTGKGRAEIEAFLSDTFETASGMVEKFREKAEEFSGRAAQTVQEQYENVSNRIGEASAEAQEFVRQKPAESVGIAFGAGLLAGVLLTLVMRSR